MRTLGIFFKHGSNAALAVIACTLALAFGFAGSPPAWWAVGAGALVFVGSEYTTHRFLLHAAPRSQPFVRSLQHRLHYDHHVDPSDLGLLFLPLWFALPVALVTALLYVAITRDLARTGALLLGSVVALLYYEWVHYVAHIALIPRTRFGRWIKKYHLRHHFLNERLWFGVTNPSMDFVGRTYRAVTAAERSTTTRTLFPKP